MDFEAIDDAFRASPLMQELTDVFESGEFNRFDADAKRQHFVPRFLLGHFAVQLGESELLYQLDVATGVALRVKSSEAASRRYFYALLDEEGNRNNRIEGFLSRVEAHAADALDRYADGPHRGRAHARARLAFDEGMTRS